MGSAQRRPHRRLPDARDQPGGQQHLGTDGTLAAARSDVREPVLGGRHAAAGNVRGAQRSGADPVLMLHALMASALVI